MMPNNHAHSTVNTTPNLLTVDVEDWFHICGVTRWLPRDRWDRLQGRVVPNTLALLELFERFQVKATFFVLGWVAERQPDLVREIARQGHEVASHGYGHQRVYTLLRQEFERDLHRSLEILTPLAGRAILGYRAPEWSIRRDNLWALDILAQAGLRYDASMAPLPVIGHQDGPRGIHRRHTRYGTLWEVPPLVGSTPWVNLPVGGGWGLRTFPYGLIRFFIRRQNRRHGPALLFFHPREVDPALPGLRLPMIKRFVVSAGLRSTASRLVALLRDYRFTTIQNFLAGLLPTMDKNKSEKEKA
jgi:polysaccharide deacetylase family protein (PEP-CTERM system associated)